MPQAPAIVFVGLGNSGDEYAGTRHNVGREFLDFFRRRVKFPDWRHDPKLLALVSGGKIDRREVLLVCPETMMNRSGDSVAKLLGGKEAGRLVVINDDLDLLLGTFKLSFNRGAGGHRGIESIIRRLKTPAFVRVRVGISPQTPSGKIKKPTGEAKVVDFILGRFRPKELEVMKRLKPKVSSALSVIVADGHEKAMNQFN